MLRVHVWMLNFTLFFFYRLTDTIVHLLTGFLLWSLWLVPFSYSAAAFVSLLVFISPSYPVFASMQCMLVQNQIGERARKTVPPYWEKEKWYMKAQSSGRMEQWADRRKAGWREWEMWERIGFRAWRAEPRHGQFVTRSGAMMEDGDILTPMEQPPQCLLYYLPAKDEVILLAPDHTKNI